MPDPVQALQPGEIGYHDSCHLSGMLQKGEPPRKVLERAAGSAFREMQGADLCCGYGGAFNIRDYSTSARIGENKLSIAAKGGTKTICAACSGCILQLRDIAAREYTSMRVVHIAELVRRALSGGEWQ
jgi:glycolate oxidase iron-sulfur subunit